MEKIPWNGKFAVVTGSLTGIRPAAEAISLAQAGRLRFKILAGHIGASAPRVNRPYEAVHNCPAMRQAGRNYDRSRRSPGKSAGSCLTRSTRSPCRHPGHNAHHWSQQLWDEHGS